MMCICFFFQVFYFLIMDSVEIVETIRRLGRLLRYLLLRAVKSRAPFDIPKCEFITELNRNHSGGTLEYVRLLHHLRDDCYNQWFIAAVRLRGDKRCCLKKCHMCPTPEFQLLTSDFDESQLIDEPTEARLNKPKWMRF